MFIPAEDLAVSQQRCVYSGRPHVRRQRHVKHVGVSCIIPLRSGQADLDCQTHSTKETLYSQQNLLRMVLMYATCICASTCSLLCIVLQHLIQTGGWMHMRLHLPFLTV